MLVSGETCIFISPKHWVNPFVRGEHCYWFKWQSNCCVNGRLLLVSMKPLILLFVYPLLGDESETENMVVYFILFESSIQNWMTANAVSLLLLLRFLWFYLCGRYVKCLCFIFFTRGTEDEFRMLKVGGFMGVYVCLISAQQRSLNLALTQVLIPNYKPVAKLDSS